jgi:quinol monooxygenase YgiN
MKNSRKEIMDLLIPLITPPRKRESNIKYTFNSSIDNPNELLFDEVCKNKEAYNKHFQSQESIDLQAKLQDLVSKPIEFKIFKEINRLQR